MHTTNELHGWTLHITLLTSPDRPNRFSFVDMYHNFCIEILYPPETVQKEVGSAERQKDGIRAGSHNTTHRI